MECSGVDRWSSLFFGGVLSASLLFASWCLRCTLSELKCCSDVAEAKLDPVNRPDLLPKEQTTVIDVAGFLTPGEA